MLTPKSLIEFVMTGVDLSIKTKRNHKTQKEKLDICENHLFRLKK